LTDSAYTDIELREWLRSEYERGSNFMRVLAEASFLADVHTYGVLKPVLIELQKTQAQDLNEASLE
jgi:hypothetical protein